MVDEDVAAVGRLLTAHTGEVVADSVSADGRTIATGSADGTIRLYDSATQATVGAQHACAVAGRTLTRAEWNDALPGRAFAPACTS